MAIFNGTSGNDTLTGAATDDTINGLAGDDNIRDYLGNNIIDGGLGDDFIATNATSIVDGGDGVDTYSINPSNFLGISDPVATRISIKVNANGTITNNDTGFVIAKNIESLSATGVDGSYLDAASSPYNVTFAAGLNDTLIGGNGDDRLTTSSSSVMKGGQGNDSYGVSRGFQSQQIVEIDDAGGDNDVLNLGLLGNNRLGFNINVGLDSVRRSGTTLEISLARPFYNTFSPDTLLSIRNFFTPAGTPGTGYIEKIQSNLQGGFNPILDVSSLLQRPIPNDFHRNDKSDILWRAGNGDVVMWRLDGTNIINNDIVATAVDQTWKIVDTGDFNADGFADVLWYNTSGAVSLWQMNGSTIQTAGLVSTGVDTSWKISTTGDFNADSKTDIFWRNVNGDVAIWKMDGQSIVSSKVLGNVDNSWKAADTGDFNGDRKDDVLWRKDNGDVAIWLMDGDAVSNTVVRGNVSLDWKIAGVNDFNDDGKADIIWQNQDGRIALWQMNGTDIVFADVIGNAPGFIVVATGDYNGDNKGDLLFRNAQGANAIWNTDGKNIVNQNAIVGTDPSWTAAPSNGLTPPPVLLT
jgi:hypothetical protein